MQTYARGIFLERNCFYITLRVIFLSLPSTGIIGVSKIAFHFSVLKTDNRTGSRVQADLKYENCNVSFKGLRACLKTYKKIIFRCRVLQLHQNTACYTIFTNKLRKYVS